MVHLHVVSDLFGSPSFGCPVQQCKESPGLYYDCIAEAHLYSTEWKVVTYINLEIVDDNFEL